MKPVSFITGAEFPMATLQKLITDAISYKNGGKPPRASNKLLTLIFANPSLRTQLSFLAAMERLGGNANILHTATSWQFEYRDGVVMDGNKQEHIKEAAAVISRYSDLIGLRHSELITTAATHGETAAWDQLRKDEPINKFAQYAEKPVINMESNMFHPCQSMADMMTIVENFGPLKGAAKKKYVLTWVPHPKALPLATPHSQLLTPAIFGMDVVLAHPEEFPLDAEVVELAQKNAQRSGGSIAITHNQQEAFKNSNVVVAKSWASLKYFGQWDKEAACRKKYDKWKVDSQKMKLTNNAIFLHCLPVRRNVEVADEVLDSAASAVIDEAENRMWIQMAIINYLLNLN